MDFVVEQGIELVSSSSEEGESDEDYEVEDNEEDADVDENSGRMTLRQVLYGNRGSSDPANAMVSSNQSVYHYGETFGNSDDIVRERTTQRRGSKGCKGIESAPIEGGGYSSENSQGDLNRGETDGLVCPICFEPWSSGGDHHICCLPCGHIYGLSCIKRWLQRRGSSKCPHCKKKCALKDIRLLYASRVVAVDGELQKKVQYLEAKCTSLEIKNAEWSKKEAEWKKIEAEFCKNMQCIEKRTKDLEGLLQDMERRQSGSYASSWNSPGASGTYVQQKFPHQQPANIFNSQDFRVDGARLFEIDSSSQIILIARRLPGMGGLHVLTKMSLLSNHEMEDIHLPVNTKAVKDLHVSPHARLVLLSSLGKKLSVISTESNNSVLAYDLPAAAWSCSWDVCNSHFLYAGLQNGTVLQFDMRQTGRHVESLTGLTGNPIHSIQCLSPDASLGSGLRSVLTASSVGICQWNFGRHEERPYLIPESDKQGVCISLAYSPTSDYIVTSYRPKIVTSGHVELSQPMLTPAASIASGQSVQGSHVLYKRTAGSYQKLGATCANVSGIRLPKSCIIDGESKDPTFVSGDEETHELVLRELPSLMVVEHLNTRKSPILDVKYTRVSSSGLLGCLSEDILQLFTAKFL